MLARHPEALLVLLVPPSADVQAERLRRRGEDEEVVAQRLEKGRQEEGEGRALTRYVVVNDELERAVSQVAGILEDRRRGAPADPSTGPPNRSLMAQRRPTLMDPPIEELLDQVDSKFTLVALSAKRARQINSYYNQLGEGLGVVVPPQVTSVSGKPLTIAFEEIAEAKAGFHRPEPGDAEEAEPTGEEPGLEAAADSDAAASAAADEGEADSGA